MLAGKPFSGTAKPGVNFVQNQQHAVFVAELAEHRQKFLRRDVDAAARLHRLDQNGADGFATEEVANALLDFAAAEVTRLIPACF